MSILTDEELNSIKDDHRDQLVELDLLRSVEALLMSKLAEQAAEPAVWSYHQNGWEHFTYDKREWCGADDIDDVAKLYTEAQLLAAQQRTAEACAKYLTSGRYMVLRPLEQLSADKHAQALKSHDAHQAKAISNGEWRKYL